MFRLAAQPAAAADPNGTYSCIALSVISVIADIRSSSVINGITVITVINFITFTIDCLTSGSVIRGTNRLSIKRASIVCQR